MIGFGGGTYVRRRRALPQKFFSSLSPAASPFHFVPLSSRGVIQSSIACLLIMNWLILSFIFALCCRSAGAFAARSPSSASTKRSSTTSLYGVRSAVRRARDSFLSKERTDSDLKDGIAFFYDRSSKLWEDVWGEHMHQ